MVRCNRALAMCACLGFEDSSGDLARIEVNPGYVSLRESRKEVFHASDLVGDRGICGNLVAPGFGKENSNASASYERSCCARRQSYPAIRLASGRLRYHQQNIVKHVHQRRSVKIPRATGTNYEGVMRLDRLGGIFHRLAPLSGSLGAGVEARIPAPAPLNLLSHSGVL